MKPVQLLVKLCKEGKVDGPHFSNGTVRVGEKTFTLNKSDGGFPFTRDTAAGTDNNKSRYFSSPGKLMYSHKCPYVHKPWGFGAAILVAMIDEPIGHLN